MNEFKVISIMNEAMIMALKDKNVDYSENLKVEELLKDEALFFKINKEEAYNILTSVGVKQDQLQNAYKKLTSSDVFYNLLNKGKINAKEENLIVKYNIYDYDNLFKKKNKN